MNCHAVHAPKPKHDMLDMLANTIATRAWTLPCCLILLRRSDLANLFGSSPGNGAQDILKHNPQYSQKSSTCRPLPLVRTGMPGQDPLAVRASLSSPGSIEAE